MLTASEILSFYRTNGYAKHTEFTIRFTTLRGDWRIKPRIVGRRSIGEPLPTDSGTTARVRSSFYTNDKDKSRLEVVIEGIATDGSVCRTLQNWSDSEIGNLIRMDVYFICYKRIVKNKDMKQGVFRVMLLLLGIMAGFGEVRPSVSDGSEPDTVSSPELDSLASFFAGVQSRHPEKLYLHLNQPYYGGRRHHVVQGLSDGRRIPQARYALELHIRRPGRQVREGRRGTEDQARFAGVCETGSPLPDTLPARRVHPQGVYRMDAELRARILLPAQHQRGEIPVQTAYEPT